MRLKNIAYFGEKVFPNLPYSYTVQYIILNNGILKLNSSVLPSSEGYISQYTPKGVYRLFANVINAGINSIGGRLGMPFIIQREKLPHIYSQYATNQ